MQKDFSTKIEKYLQENAYKTLYYDGLQKVKDNISSKKELFKVISVQDEV